MTIRPAATSDIDAIAALHALSWRTSYRRILPNAFLDGPVEGDRTSHWCEMMEGVGEERTVFVAEAGGNLTGFVSVARSSEQGFDGYIEHIHVRPDLKGAGIGRQLMAAAADRLIAMGCGSAYLLVFDGNRRAIRFYEALGGRSSPFGMEDMAGKRISRLRTAWYDLPALAKACREYG